MIALILRNRSSQTTAPRKQSHHLPSRWPEFPDISESSLPFLAPLTRENSAPSSPRCVCAAPVVCPLPLNSIVRRGLRQLEPLDALIATMPPLSHGGQPCGPQARVFAIPAAAPSKLITTYFPAWSRIYSLLDNAGQPSFSLFSKKRNTKPTSPAQPTAAMSSWRPSPEGGNGKSP